MISSDRTAVGSTVPRTLSRHLRISPSLSRAIASAKQVLAILKVWIQTTPGNMAEPRDESAARHRVSTIQATPRLAADRPTAILIHEETGRRSWSGCTRRLELEGA